MCEVDPVPPIILPAAPVGVANVLTGPAPPIIRPSPLAKSIAEDSGIVVAPPVTPPEVVV